MQCYHLDPSLTLINPRSVPKKGPKTILITLYQSQYFHLIHHNHLQWKAVGSKKREDFNVIIVGSGIGGICLGKKLVDLGIR